MFILDTIKNRTSCRTFKPVPLSPADTNYDSRQKWLQAKKLYGLPLFRQPPRPVKW